MNLDYDYLFKFIIVGESSKPFFIQVLAKAVYSFDF